MNIKTETRIKNILNHLRGDGRASQASIAKKEGVVTSRIHKLHKEAENKYIKKYATILHFEKIKHPFRAIHFIEKQKNNNRQEEKLQQYKEANNIHTLTNESIIMESIHQTLAEQERFSEKLKEEGNTIHSQHNIITVLAQEEWRIR